jgi:hypothetical protein
MKKENKMKRRIAKCLKKLVESGIGYILILESTNTKTSDVNVESLNKEQQSVINKSQIKLNL